MTIKNHFELQIIDTLQKEVREAKERITNLHKNLDERIDQLLRLGLSVRKLLEEIYPPMYQYRATEIRTEKAIEECKEIVRKLKERKVVVVNHRLMEMAKYLLREGFIIVKARGNGFLCGQWQTSKKYGKVYFSHIARGDTEDEAIENGYKALREGEEEWNG